ncbi:hypothetical protein [Chryseobacterium sp. JV274]|uniref:hypothetical protein n=1 Tax=unclassified Chryseobacterium TaxID=2593645 RepID=UPI0015C24B90|nr:hypothetical protein [Chryseobacterium sp. JV274]CAD0221558.1 conserved exported protein of unknown function [Chryseobacterium sp. JV274]
MKKITLILLSLIISSCHSQDKEPNKNAPSKDIKKPKSLEIPVNQKTMETFTNEKFDIENYFKHYDKINRTYEHESSNGTKILEADFDDSYYVTLIAKNSLFAVHKEYYKNGLLKSKWETFGEGGFIKGFRYEYDLKGKLLKVEDWDKPYKFTWEQVKKYIEQDLKLNILKDKVGVSNKLESPDYNFPTWGIDYIGQYKDDPKKGIIRIKLSGLTGELLLVERQLGKGGDGTNVDVIYKKKN